MESNIAVVGDNHLARELSELGKEKGISIRLCPRSDELSPATSFVIEALIGPEELKRESVRTASEKAPKALILCSCLGLTVTRMASWTDKPESVAGFGSFYPIKEKKLIELVYGLRTQEAVLKEAESLFGALGKQTVRLSEAAGPIFPRVVCAIINEAARGFDEGVAKAEEIDVAMKLGVNYPKGPLRWADEIGLDQVLAVLDGLRRETGDDRYRPAPILRRMVMAGWLGERTGKGFYEYKT